MLFILIKSIVWLLISLCYGSAVVRLGHKITGNQPQQPVAAPLVNLMGLAALSLVPALLNYFMPIGALASAIAVAGAIGLGFWAKDVLQDALKQWKNLILSNVWVFGAATLLVVFFASRQSIWIDEGVYHAQFIKWIEDYPIVPGLGNVQHRLAFNSHWHVLSALLNGSFITGQESNHINALLYLIGFGYFLGNTRQGGYIRYFGWGFLIAMHLPFVLCYHLIPPSADYALMIISWVLFSLAISKWEQGVFWQTDSKAWAMLFLSVFAITVKVSAAPMLLLPGIIWLGAIIKQKRFSYLLICSLLALTFWLPWVGRNYILSGSLVFPVRITALHPTWEVGDKLYDEALDGIIANGYTLYKPNAVKVLRNDGLVVKLKKWFFHNIRFYDRVIIFSALVLPFGLFFFRKRIKDPKTLAVIVVGLYAGMGYWLVTAPDPRFGWGYIISLLLISVVVGAWPLLQKDGALRFVKPLSLGAILLFWLGSFFLYQYFSQQFMGDGRLVASQSNTAGLLMPYPYPTIATSQQGIFKVAGDIHTCWATDLPCIEYQDTAIIPMGNKLTDGFRYDD